MRVLTAESYFQAWRYIPFLVLAAIYAALAAFLNSVYMVQKKSGLSLLTMTIGAAANLLLNWLLIPRMGPSGAAFATLLSYALVFVIRTFTVTKFVKIRYAPARLFFSTLLLLLMSLLMLQGEGLWLLWCILAMAVVAAINVMPLYRGIMPLLLRRKTTGKG